MGIFPGGKKKKSRQADPKAQEIVFKTVQIATDVTKTITLF